MTQNQDLPLPVGHYLTLHNGLRLHYLDEGQGPVVLWLHGSGPSASGFSNFKGNYPVLAEAGYRNIVLDLPGFGRSDKPDTGMYDLEFFVATLRAFTQALDITRCTLLGNSLGAIALGLALAEPELAEKLILLARRRGGARDLFPDAGHPAHGLAVRRRAYRPAGNAQHDEPAAIRSLDPARGAAG